MVSLPLIVAVKWLSMAGYLMLFLSQVHVAY